MMVTDKALRQKVSDLKRRVEELEKAVKARTGLLGGLAELQNPIIRSLSADHCLRVLGMRHL